MTRVMLTRTAHDRFVEQFRAAAPDATFLAMEPSGEVFDGDVELDREDTTAAIAFASGDLFDDADRERRVRSFFGWLIHTRGLDWMQVAAAGVDNPVFESLLRDGVRLTNSHHTAIPISEYVLAQVLRHRLPLDAMATDRLARRWQGHEWDEVASSRWLVIGVGAIGSAISSRARSFGARVTGVRRTPTGDEPVDTMIRPDTVHEVLGHNDIVVLATPATSATVGMVDAGFLRRLGAGTVLVNIGRGSLVDEDALRGHLDRDPTFRAILDVTATEPLPAAHWLWTHPQVTLTAHTSAGGRQRHQRAADLFAANLHRYVTSGELVDEVGLDDR